MQRIKYKRLDQLSKRSLKRRLHTSTTENNCPQNHVELDSDRESIHSSYMSDKENVLKPEPPNVEEFIINWSQSFNIQHNALNALLVFLKTTSFPYLPRDARTLLQTPKSRETVKIGDDGYYVHIGARVALDKIMKDNENVDEINLDINIDGLPISRSSTSGFWMILGKISNIQHQSPFVIGVYHGHKKPTQFCDFLQPHVEELKELMKNYSLNGKNITVKVCAYICDAPARSAVTGSKGHNARSGCNKCVVEGDFLKNRMTFLRVGAPLRTDASFRAREDENHHRYTSPIEQLELDMVNAFPHDYLHLVCLGIVKRLVRMWINGDKRSLMSSQTIQRISNDLIVISCSQPSIFQRKIRPLNDFGYFKGSELRTFLLYAGPVALKNHLPKEMYDNFMLLHVAISILCNKQKYKSYSTLAQALLVRFIENYAEIYGDHHVVYNVHCLSHLVADTKLFGCLDDFSAFPFESFMSKIKQLLRKNNQPLAQLCNRLHEMHASGHHQRFQIGSTGICLKKQISYNENTGQFCYKEILVDGLRFNTNFKEKWFFTNTNEIVGITKIVKQKEMIVLIGHEITQKKDFFSIPIKSNYLDIYETNGTVSNCEKQYCLSSIKHKLFAMRSGEDVIFYPLLHTN